MLLAAMAIIAAALLNRLRGGGWFAERLPGRALWWVAPAIGLVELLTPGAGWISAGAAALLYLGWGIGPWGHWYDLGRLDGRMTRPFTPVERIVDRLSRGNNHLALLIRHAVPLVVGLGALTLWRDGTWHGAFAGVAAGAAIVAAYEASWRLHAAGRTANPIREAELITGVIWAALLITVI